MDSRWLFGSRPSVKVMEQGQHFRNSEPGLGLCFPEEVETQDGSGQMPCRAIRGCSGDSAFDAVSAGVLGL